MRKTTREEAVASVSSVWRLTVTLRDVRPVVWRTILVRPDTKLAMLHRYIQAAMGWKECHLYAFTIDEREYLVPNREFESHKKTYDARRYALARLFPAANAAFRYVYDFGDHWEHDVIVEGVEPAVYRKQYPICIDGAEPCPPEDCGGPAGYDRFRAIMDDPEDPQYADMRAWARSQYYDGRFDPQFATWAMRDTQRGYR